MRQKYCYWSVCDGAYGALMENCVRTARAAGVFKEFHVLTDRPLEGCECYDACQIPKEHGLFKLEYLKVGMSRLLFDYFVWIDADTIFTRNPVDVLGVMGKSPVHVPLERDISAIDVDASWGGVPLRRAADALQKSSVSTPVYFCGSSFWIVHHDAIDAVYSQAREFRHHWARLGVSFDISASLAFAMRIFCGDAERHRVSAHPELWAPWPEDSASGLPINGGPWRWREPFGGNELEVRPAIVHVPGLKTPKLRGIGRDAGTIVEVCAAGADRFGLPER